VISVIVYGRNDAHGYNLHRRAALSLNCIAEVLGDPDDEIVFVDYNTPDELPTFVEALADTLTDRCLMLLRVFRVPAAIHEQRFRGRTHLPVIEPVARNAAVRRANPSNRWLLSTNTDMILLPHSDQGLSDICSELPDGFYGLPRYELPEWLWEQLPRTDPRRAMSTIERLGPGLALDEPTVSNKWIRFDAPGDFQLVLRKDFVAINGLDEEMLLGYHVDSNLSRRMLFHRGSIESLGGSLSGYHCNHNRERTVYHGTGKVANDLDRFVYTVDEPTLPGQRATWGLAEVALEEVEVGERSEQGFAATLLTAIPKSAGSRKASDAARVPLEATYDSAHVLPFIADLLAVSPSDAIVGYLGTNPVLEGMLATVVARLGVKRRLEVADLDHLTSVDELVRNAHVFVVDLGIDSSLVDSSRSTSNGYEPAPLPARLELAFAALERLVELERARLARGEHPRRIMLVHSATVFWDSYVLAHLDCSHTTAHSRVRRATVKPIPTDDEATKAALARDRRLIRWAVRDGQRRGRLHLRPGEVVNLADLDDYLGFRDGWSYPDAEGKVWTQGLRSELALGFEGVGKDDYLLALYLDSVCVGPDAPLKVELVLDGEAVASRTFSRWEPTATWHITVPARVLAERKADISFVIEEPRSPRALGWSADDERPLGILISALALVSPDDQATRVALVRERRLVRWAARDGLGSGRLHVRLGEAVELADLDDYRGFRQGWSYPEERGIWTQGSRSDLALSLEGVGEGDCLLALALDGVCVGSDAPLTVDLLRDGEHVASRVFRHDDPNLTWHVELPTRALGEGKVDVSFAIEEPRSPLALGWSIDERPLGILIRALAVVSSDDGPTRTALVRERRLVRWAARERGRGHLHVRPDAALELADLDDYRGFGHGWSYPDEAGIWTQGPRSELALTLDEVDENLVREQDCLLALSLSSVCVGSEAPLKVELSFDGEWVASRAFSHDEPTATWQVELPARVLAAGKVDVSLVIEEPRSPLAVGWSTDDNRPLGILIQAVTLETVDRTVRPGERIVFIESSGADRLLGDGWSELEPTGVWTVSEAASLILKPSAPAGLDVELVLGISAFVTRDHRKLELEVSVGGERLAEHIFRHRRAHSRIHVPLPAVARDATGRTVLELALRDPMRPADLGVSEDVRRLGIHLRSLTMRRKGLRGKLADAVRDVSAKVLKRLM
jgi:hypothetical protein